MYYNNELIKLIRENIVTIKDKEGIVIEEYKDTFVVQHVYDLDTKEELTEADIADDRINRRIIQFRIAVDNKPYPDSDRLKEIIEVDNKDLHECTFDECAGMCKDCKNAIIAHVKEKFKNDAKFKSLKEV